MVMPSCVGGRHFLPRALHIPSHKGMLASFVCFVCNFLHVANVVARRDRMNAKYSNMIGMFLCGGVNCCVSSGISSGTVLSRSVSRM